MAFRLYRLFGDMLKEQDLESLFFDVEMKLLGVLAAMERVGVRIDRDYFASLGVENDRMLMETEKMIYHEAGQTFNINSTRELAACFSTAGAQARPKDQDRLFHGHKRSGVAAGASRHCRSPHRLQDALQAEEHIYRRPAQAHQSAHGQDTHILQTRPWWPRAVSRPPIPIFRTFRCATSSARTSAGDSFPPRGLSCSRPTIRRLSSVWPPISRG